MILTLAAAGACRYIHLFTRFAGELFGALIAVSPPITKAIPTSGVRRDFKYMHHVGLDDGVAAPASLVH